MSYETPTLETYGGVDELTEIVDGSYGDGEPGIPFTS